MAISTAFPVIAPQPPSPLIPLICGCLFVAIILFFYLKLKLKGNKDLIDNAKQIAILSISFNKIKRSKCFPPINILNDFFQCGTDDIESEETLIWKPFDLSSEEYLIFYDWCCEQYGDLEINKFDNCTGYSEWFIRAGDKN
ncbi:MAG: hypothetical protein COA79_21185 [Planctomycetota bacterium]|nr:MAG: hypothetical protein COA79_21185 [Planctomycetota bacterium]